MKIIRIPIVILTFGMLPFYTIAQSISASVHQCISASVHQCISASASASASASTLDDSEAKISAQAAAKGILYNITSAQYKNYVYMTGKLTQ